MTAVRQAGPHPARRRPLLRGRAGWGLLLWIALALTFVILATLASFYDRLPADERIAHAVQDSDAPAVGGFFDFENALGLALVYIPLTLGLAALLAVRRAGSESVLVLLTFVVRGVSSLVKDWVERPRPSAKLIDIPGDYSGFSFPSGHTVGTGVLFGVLFFVIPAVVSWRPLRWLLQAGCLLLVLAAGPARVYVGAHWPSDVLGGYLLALLALGPAAVVYLTFRGKP
jgi:undecaprenyl-diphosphatase